MSASPACTKCKKPIEVPLCPDCSSGKDTMECTEQPKNGHVSGDTNNVKQTEMTSRDYYFDS